MEEKKQQTICNRLFDEKLFQQRKLRALHLSLDKNNPLMKLVAKDLADRLEMIKYKFETALSLFSFTSHAEEILKKIETISSVQRIETHADFLKNGEGLVAGIEEVPIQKAEKDLIVSLLSLHQINDLPKILSGIRKMLRPNGLFLAAMFGNNTLQELRESLLIAETEIYNLVTPRVLPFISTREASIILQQAGFYLPVIDVETFVVRYNNLFSLISDLRAMGETNTLICRTRTPARRAFFQRAAAEYSRRFADSDGRIQATFSIIWLSGWGQQNPIN